MSGCKIKNLGAVQYGTQTKDYLIVSTDNRTIHCIDKEDSSKVRNFTFNWPTPTVFCCTLSPGKRVVD